MRSKLPQLREALAGRFGAHQRFPVAQHRAHTEYLAEAIDQVRAESEERLRPFEVEVALLDSIPGGDRIVAQGMLAEMGLPDGRQAQT